MRELTAIFVGLVLVSSAHAYTIKHSCSGKKKPIEYYAACNNGQLPKVTKYDDGRFSYEGSAGTSTLNGRASLDKAAAAASGE